MKAEKAREQPNREAVAGLQLSLPIAALLVANSMPRLTSILEVERFYTSTVPITYYTKYYIILYTTIYYIICAPSLLYSISHVTYCHIIYIKGYEAQEAEGLQLPDVVKALRHALHSQRPCAGRGDERQQQLAPGAPAQQEAAQQQGGAEGLVALREAVAVQGVQQRHQAELHGEQEPGQGHPWRS